MKIPKLFKKAAAFVMAAVTALSIMPATAFAAGDIGTISFSHTYDSNGNAMRYNSSANIGGYTAGGTGNYKYRMFVDGENAFCIQPGVPLKTGNTLKKASSDTWNALSANQKKAVGLALLYGYQGNRNNLSGSDDEKWLATQTLVWEFVTGCREATGSYNQTSTTVYSLHFGSNYANSGARAVYDQIVAMLREHNTIPSFMSGGKNDITKELAYKDGKYSITLTDSNGVLSDYSFSSSDSNVSVSKSGNKLTISSTVAISGSVRITASSDMGNVKADSTYGTKRASAYRIIEDTLNLRDTRIFDYVYDEHGNKKAVFNEPLKKYDVTLTAHYRKTVSVYAESPEQAKEKTKIILFDTDLINFTDDDFVCGEADITEQSEDGLDGAGENTLQENEDCSDCPYFCPVCGECMYEDDCEE